MVPARLRDLSTPFFAHLTVARRRSSMPLSQFCRAPVWFSNAASLFREASLAFETSCALRVRASWKTCGTTRELVALFSTRGEVRRRNEIAHAHYTTLFFGQHVSSALDPPSLKSSLEMGLPLAGVRTAWLSRFASDTTTELEPLA